MADLVSGAVNLCTGVLDRDTSNPATLDVDYNLVAVSVNGGLWEQTRGYKVKLDCNPMTIPLYPWLQGVGGRAELWKGNALLSSGTVSGYKFGTFVHGAIEWDGSPAGGGAFGFSVRQDSASFNIDLP